VGKIQPSEIFFLWLLKPQHVFSLDDGLGWVNVKMGRTTEGRSFAEKYGYVLERLGVKGICHDFIIPMPPASTSGTAGTSNRDIVFNPFASRTDKSLSTIKAVQALRCLAEALPERRIGILSSPQTRAESRQLAEWVARDNVDALDRIETVQDAIAVISAAEVVVSVDTAIVHIAAGLKRRLVAIYPFMQDEYNPWLPPDSPLTRIIFSRQNVTRYRRTGIKDMNNFEERELLECLKLLLTKPQ
jgi:ADP-heptose:LPS heptosyltransferase